MELLDTKARNRANRLPITHEFCYRPSTMKPLIPSALIDAFREEKVILFVGAGLSGLGGHGYPTGSKLIELFREQQVNDSDGGVMTLGELIGDRFCDLPEVAGYLEQRAGPERLVALIKGLYNNPVVASGAVHQHLWELPNIRHIYTTNFDPLIEQGLGLSRIRAEPTVLVNPENARELSAKDYVVFKIHGCAVKSQRREDFVITARDYLDFPHSHPLRKLKAQSELMQKVFLFLGYSLRDQVFRSLYQEVRRFAGGSLQSCYAVIQDIEQPEIEYWQELGIHILKGDAADAVRQIKDHKALRFRTSWYEWRGKEGAREKDKQVIARVAFDKIFPTSEKREEKSNGSVTLLVDSGTSTLAFARHMKDLLDRELADFKHFKHINLITNCTAVLDTLRWAHLPEKDHQGNPQQPSLAVFVVGGRLRTETQALVPPLLTTAHANGSKVAGHSIRILLQSIRPPQPVIAVMGATSISEAGFRTNTMEEVAVKEAMIRNAEQIYFLVDHSKFRSGGRELFLSLKDAAGYWVRDRKPTCLITDRKPDKDTAAAFDRHHIKVVVAGELHT